MISDYPVDSKRILDSPNHGSLPWACRGVGHSRPTSSPQPVWVGHSCPTKDQHRPSGPTFLSSILMTNRVGRTFLSDKGSAQPVWVGHSCPTKDQHRPCGSDIPVRQESTSEASKTELMEKRSESRTASSVEERPLRAASKWFDSEKRALARQRTLQHVREGHEFSCAK